MRKINFVFLFICVDKEIEDNHEHDTGVDVSASAAAVLAVIIPVMARLNSVRVTSYKSLRKTKNGLKLCALDPANETMSSSSMNDCSLKCARDAICTGYNIKNSLTCDHINTPVGLPVGLLGTTSRTRLPVICTIINRGSPPFCRPARSSRLLKLKTLSFFISDVMSFVDFIEYCNIYELEYTFLYFKLCFCFASANE